MNSSRMGLVGLMVAVFVCSSALPSVGWGWVEQSRGAFFWSADTGVTRLGTLGGSWSESTDVNQQGQVVGYSADQNGNKSIFLWSAASGMNKVELPSGFRCGYGSQNKYQKLFIDDYGRVTTTLYSTTSTSTCRAFRWTNSNGWQMLPTYRNGDSNYVTAVSTLGQVVGGSDDVFGNLYNVRWGSNGAVADPGLPRVVLGTTRECSAVNDNGSVLIGDTIYYTDEPALRIGQWANAMNNLEHAIDSSRFCSLETGWINSGLYEQSDISDLDVIAGCRYFSVLSKEVMTPHYDFGQYVGPTLVSGYLGASVAAIGGPGGLVTVLWEGSAPSVGPVLDQDRWTTSSAVAISNAGYVAGNLKDMAFDYSNPPPVITPEPSSILAILGGLTSLLAFRRRKA